MWIIDELRDMWANLAQNDREYRWFRQHEPCRYVPYKDPDCPINWIDGNPKLVYRPNPKHSPSCPCNTREGGLAS